MPFRKEQVFAEEVAKANLERFAHLIGVYGLVDDPWEIVGFEECLQWQRIFHRLREAPTTHNWSIKLEKRGNLPENQYSPMKNDLCSSKRCLEKSLNEYIEYHHYAPARSSVPDTLPLFIIHLSHLPAIYKG